MGNCNYSVTGLFQLGSSFFFMPASQVCSPRHTRNLPVLSKGAVAAAILALTLAPIDASSPKPFQAARQADFLKGDVENLSIDGHGQLVLGPAIELVYETSAPSLWAVAAGPDGSLFIGSGNAGKGFRGDPQGKGSPFFDTNELQVHALAPAPHGRL